MTKWLEHFRRPGRSDKVRDANCPKKPNRCQRRPNSERWVHQGPSNARAVEDVIAIEDERVFGGLS